MPTTEDIRAVAPALERYAKDVVRGDLWKRPGLPARDRSIVTVAALIARDQTVEFARTAVPASTSSQVCTPTTFSPPRRSWCMVIKPSLEKTAQRRIVPIHSHVIEQGFLAHVEQRRKLNKPVFYDPARSRGGNRATRSSRRWLNGSANGCMASGSRWA
jgi:hypothetical protein